MADTAAPRFLRDLKAPAVDRGQAVTFGTDRPLVLDSGKVLTPFTLAYMTYGRSEEHTSELQSRLHLRMPSSA